MIAAIVALAQAAFEREGITVPFPGPGWEVRSVPLNREGAPPLVRVERASDGLAFTVTRVVEDRPFDEARRASLRKYMGEIRAEGRGRLGPWETWWVEYEAEGLQVGVRSKSVWVVAGRRRILFHFQVPRDRYTRETGMLFDGWVDRCTILPEESEPSIPRLSWILFGAGVVVAIAVMMLIRRRR